MQWQPQHEDLRPRPPVGSALTDAADRGRVVMSRVCGLIGLVIWVLYAAAWVPDLQNPRWVVALVLFAPLVLMPLAQPLCRARAPSWISQVLYLTAAALLAPAFDHPPGFWSAMATLPWLYTCAVVALGAIKEWWPRRASGAVGLCFHSARVFPVVGAAWLLSNRWELRPLGIPDSVALLTAAHFFHAGFALPLITALHGRARGRPLAAPAAAVLVLVGVPLVAVGITCTHLGIWLSLESFAVAVVAAGAFITAAMQIARAVDAPLGWWRRPLLGLSGVSLMAAMLLALGFGLRTVWPELALPLPLMWAIHGTLNVFGFGLLGLLGWLPALARKVED